MIEQLRSDMEGLITELADLGRRNDELMTAKDADLAVIRDLDNQLKEYKRKYELAKTELRSVKGEPSFFILSAPILNTFLLILSYFPVVYASSQDGRSDAHGFGWWAGRHTCHCLCIGNRQPPGSRTDKCTDTRPHAYENCRKLYLGDNRRCSSIRVATYACQYRH